MRNLASMNKTKSNQVASQHQPQVYADYVHVHTCAHTHVNLHTYMHATHTCMRKIKIKNNESQCLNYFSLGFPGSPDAGLQAHHSREVFPIEEGERSQDLLG